MTPSDALAAQIRHYRSLTGEERLEIALQMYELSSEIARSGIRMQHPHADSARVEELLRARRRLVVGL